MTAYYWTHLGRVPGCRSSCYPPGSAGRTPLDLAGGEPSTNVRARGFMAQARQRQDINAWRCKIPEVSGLGSDRLRGQRCYSDSPIPFLSEGEDKDFDPYILFYSKFTSKFLSELLKTKVCQRKYDKIRTRIAIFGSKRLQSKQAWFLTYFLWQTLVFSNSLRNLEVSLE